MESASRRSFSTVACHWLWIRSVIPKPCSAVAAAGSSTSLKLRFPKRFCSRHQPSTAPGTVVELTPLCGIPVSWS